MNMWDRTEWEKWDNALTQARAALGGVAGQPEPGQDDAQTVQEQYWKALAEKNRDGWTTAKDDLQRVRLHINVLMDLLRSAQRVADDLCTITSKHVKEKR
jgi:hypothetical protein